MKLSLWQQFSSNHSASFTVLGRFDTIEKAQEVEATLRALFEAIQEARGFDSRGYDEGFISWPEHEAGQMYGFAWETGIDWLGDDLSEHIIRFENNLFVTNALSDTRLYPTVLPDLMRHFTSDVYAEGGNESHDTILLTSLECRYPNDQVGRTIMDDLRLYLNPKTIEFAIPAWDSYGSMSGSYYNGALGGKAERTGLIIRIPEIAFCRTEYGLPALIAYLQAKGCEDIRYTFSSVPYASRREYM